MRRREKPETLKGYWTGELVETVFILYDSIKNGTKMAVLFQVWEETPFWIPKSQIHNECELEEDGGEVEVSEWFAIQEGLV